MVARTAWGFLRANASASAVVHISGKSIRIVDAAYRTLVRFALNYGKTAPLVADTSRTQIAAAMCFGLAVIMLAIEW